MPKKFTNLMTLIRQRRNEPYPTLEEFISLLTAEEEAYEAQNPLGTTTGSGNPAQHSQAPIVEEVAVFNPAATKSRRHRSGKRRGRGHGAGSGQSKATAPAAMAAAPTVRPPSSQRGRGSFNRGSRGGGRGRGFAPRGIPPQSSNYYTNSEQSYGAPQQYYKSGSWCQYCKQATHNTRDCWWRKKNY